MQDDNFDTSFLMIPYELLAYYIYFANISSNKDKLKYYGILNYLSNDKVKGEFKCSQM
jgi:hypothetical protein